MSAIKIKDIPKGSALLAVMGVALLVDESTVARLVQSDVVYLCGNCPCYHIKRELMTPLIFGAHVLDIRTSSEAVEIDPDLAAKLAAMGKGSK